MELCDNDADTSVVRAALAAATDDSVEVSKKLCKYFFLWMVAMLLSSEKKSSIVKITL